MDMSRGYEFLTDCPNCLTGFHEVAYPGICECKLHGHALTAPCVSYLMKTGGAN